MLAEVAPVTVEPTVEPAPLSDGPAIRGGVHTGLAVHEDGSRRIACTGTRTLHGVDAIHRHRDRRAQGDPLEVCELVSARGAHARGRPRGAVAFADCKERLRASPFVVVLAEEDAREVPARRLSERAPDRALREDTPHGRTRRLLLRESVKKVEHVGIARRRTPSSTSRIRDASSAASRRSRSTTSIARTSRRTQSTRCPRATWMKPPTFHTDGKLVIDVERTFAPPSPTLDGQLGAECQKHTETDGLAALLRRARRRSPSSRGRTPTSPRADEAPAGSVGARAQRPPPSQQPRAGVGRGKK